MAEDTLSGDAAVDMYYKLYPDTELTPVMERIIRDEGYSQLEYTDAKDVRTIGFGQTGDYRYKPFPEVVKEKEDVARGLFDHYDSFPVELRQALMSGVYRGDFEIGHKTVDLINQGKWQEAGRMFLRNSADTDDSKSYADAKENSKLRGVVTRLENISETLMAQKPLQRMPGVPPEGQAPRLAREKVYIDPYLLPGVKGSVQFQKGGKHMAKEEFYDDMGAQMELSGLVKDKDEVDPVSGNEIPLGSTAEGVRDDKTAAISAGEFVIPDYAVRYHGVDFYMKSLKVAKKGLQQMDEMGMTGKPDSASISDDKPLPTMEDEEMKPMLDKPVDTRMFVHGGLHDSTPGGIFVTPGHQFTPPTQIPSPQQPSLVSVSAGPQLAPVGVTPVAKPVSGQPLPLTYDPKVTAPTYTELQGPGAGLPGGYGIAAYENSSTGMIIYLPTIGGKLAPGTQVPPGFRPVKAGPAVPPTTLMPPSVEEPEEEEEEEDPPPIPPPAAGTMNLSYYSPGTYYEDIEGEPQGGGEWHPGALFTSDANLTAAADQGAAITGVLGDFDLAQPDAGHPLGPLGEAFIPRVFTAIYTGAQELNRKRKIGRQADDILQQQLDKGVAHVGAIDVGGELGRISFIATGRRDDGTPVITAYNAAGKLVDQRAVMEIVAINTDSNPAGLEIEDINFTKDGQINQIDSSQHMLVPWTPETGYGIDTNGLVITWDEEDGKYQDRKMTRNSWNDMTPAHQRQVLNTVGMEDRTFFSVGQFAADRGWRLKNLDNDGTTSVGDYEQPVDDEGPSWTPEPEPVSADDPGYAYGPTEGGLLEEGVEEGVPTPPKGLGVGGGTQWGTSEAAQNIRRDSEARLAKAAAAKENLEAAAAQEDLEAAKARRAASLEEFGGVEGIAKGGLVKKRTRSSSKRNKGKGLAKRK